MDLSLSLPSLCCCDCCTSGWGILTEDDDPITTEDGHPLEQEAAPS